MPWSPRCLDISPQFWFVCLAARAGIGGVPTFCEERRKRTTQSPAARQHQTRRRNPQTTHNRRPAHKQPQSLEPSSPRSSLNAQSQVSPHYLRLGIHLSVVSESQAGARARPSGPLSSTEARCLRKSAPHREFFGIYARTFQSTAIASGRDARKTAARPLETGSRARKIRTRALIVAFRRARFEIHTFVDGGARPLGGFATALEPKSRTRISISTSG